MIILGIETSFDDAAASLLEVKRGVFLLRSQVVASQAAVHACTGGVVPEVAARNHVEQIIPVIDHARGGVIPDVIAVTAGPGLITSLAVGVETARALSLLWKKPLVGVNHIEGHIAANWLAQPHPKKNPPSIQFPALVLIVSGAHTELLLMKKFGSYVRLGATVDDAAGEAFDKVAKILNLGYPGGPAISTQGALGDATAFLFPRPMLHTGNFNFSFSGLKTAVLYCMRSIPPKKRSTKKIVQDVSASFEQAVVDVLVSKTIRAAKRYRVRTILAGGGVIANMRLRTCLQQDIEEKLSSVNFFYPPPILCTDNASMIAVAGYFAAQKKKYTPWEQLRINSNWELGTNL